LVGVTFQLGSYFEELEDAEALLNRAGKEKGAKSVKTLKVDVAVKILENDIAGLESKT
jgi:hypothetical protein